MAMQRYRSIEERMLDEALWHHYYYDFKAAHNMMVALINRVVHEEKVDGKKTTYP
jgi:hypothetical protein